MVAAQRVVGERVLQDPAVVQVLVEVEQHDAAVEERTDEVRPRRAVGEGAVAVDQHLLGRVGAGSDVHPDPEDVEPEDLAVGLAQELVVPDRVVAQLQQVGEAEHRAAHVLELRRRRGHHRPPAIGMMKQICFNVSPWTPGETASRSRAVCLSGPDSLTWRFFGDHRMALLGPRAAVLQNMLPALGQGVQDHSVWFAETLARLERSIPPIYKTVYGADPEASGHEVRDFHRSIKGKLPDGSPYSALNPDTYYWAHACFVEHLITATDTFIRRLEPGGEGADLRRVDHLVRALRRQLGRNAPHLCGVRGLLRAGPRGAAGRTPYGGVRRRLRHQGLAAAEAGPATGVVAGQATGQRGELLDHDRRDAPAWPRDPRPAVERGTRTPLPAVRQDQPQAERPLQPPARALPDAPDPAASLRARGQSRLTRLGSRPGPRRLDWAHGRPLTPRTARHRLA